ncbi:hypothetical protein AB0Q95_33205 [Streptomyces sp. NPDC059900]|uniref:hypothetical protein n=1 Tax=Streptomyces sp. NPDC059900 TaxID=3155816 RepID=UPI0034452C73
MTSILDLARICPPPDIEPSIIEGVSAASVEGNVQADRRLLHEWYGGGCFNDFLWVYSPGHANRHLDANARTANLHRVLERQAAVRIRARIAELGYSISDTVSWGGTDNGDLCCWVGTDLDTLAVGLIIDCREDAFYEYAGSTGSLIHRLLSGEETCPIFPEDFWDEQPTYGRPGA